ncbi:hypothetical protein NMG29_10290 [Streptomyces cocklensis]|uniref:LPXTG-motif cell wall anchor domain-containing protein n=1 Tax=Actinacidiphila cocklensis TaxID=887465 RepID=A0A9W4GNP8_9ACTN|nr:hypothetical protein [Actinacidiphila cocklensis]MDD1058600.1 hypothetical protein [Actinacidiphila cocklensis]CAG6390777.1 conserved exported hypothetical protein [Actinacidiphila cocklensis]
MLPHRRTALRAATTTAALAGALLLPSAAAFADTGSTAAPAAGTTSDSCTATKTMSIFGEMTVDLSIGPAGPKAVLKNSKGKAVSTVDRAHPVDGPNGMMIKYPNIAGSLFLYRNEGGSTPWRSTPFPRLPKGCTDSGAGTGKETRNGCTVTQTIGSVFGEMTVDLSMSPAGPKAVLKNSKGKAVSTVDRAHPVDGPNGMMIKHPDSTAPLFLDVSEGGSALWRSNPFPKLPEDCANTAKPAPVATTGSAAPQTSAVPAGAVAAGATGVGHGNTSLVAGGGALAVASAAALGFVVTRRRRAADAGR